MAQIEERNRTSAALSHLHAQPTRPPTQAAPRTTTPRPRAPSIWARNNIFPIAAELGVPVKYVGVGEGMDDLIPFDAKNYVEALFK